MDPASIFALVEGASSLALKSASLAKSLKDLVSKYKQVKLTILSMVQGLDTIQLAWSRIEKWARNYAAIYPELGSTGSLDDEDFLHRLERSVEVGKMVMDALEEDLIPYKDIESLGFRNRTKALWNETSLRIHQDRINSQALAMSCLLQVVQLELAIDRKDLLRRSEQTLLKSDESAYSIVPSRMSSRLSFRSSIRSESGSLRYQHLDFEDVLFTARVYKRNYRTIDMQYQPSFITLAYRPPAKLQLKKPLKSPDPGTQDLIHEEHTSETNRGIGSDINEGKDSHNAARLVLDEENNLELDRVRALLSNAKYSATPDDPFYLFLRHGQVDMVERILIGESRLSKQRLMKRLGPSLTSYAVNDNDLGMTRMLLEHGAPAEGTTYGMRPLHMAAYMGSLEMLRVVLEAGASINDWDDGDYLPLQIVSIVRDRQEHIDLLIEYGANIEGISSSEGASKLTPLQLAASHGCDTNVIPM